MPENLKESPRRRLLVAQKMPAQSVFAFNRKVDDLLNKLIKCPQSKDTRHSISYFERENSVIGKTSAINGVIEAKKAKCMVSFAHAPLMLLRIYCQKL